jgi:hypothetical protein
MGSCAGGAPRESTNQTASVKFLLHGCPPQTKCAARDFKTVDDSLARHCPLQIHADLIGGFFSPCDHSCPAERLARRPNKKP